MTLDPAILDAIDAVWKRNEPTDVAFVWQYVDQLVADVRDLRADVARLERAWKQDMARADEAEARVRDLENEANSGIGDVGQLRAELDAVAIRARGLERFASFARCVIQSGESWTDVCQKEYDAALAPGSGHVTEPAPGPALDLDLLRKMLEGGPGGRRTGALKRAGLLEYHVTEAGLAALAGKEPTP